MQSSICELEHRVPPHRLEEMAKAVNYAYNSQLDDYGVWQVIVDCAPEEVIPVLDRMKDHFVGHEVANALLMKYYPSERVVKYHIAKSFMGVKRDTTLFEMTIDSSRLDLGRVNGHSYAYEIKTEFDSLTKLTKQLEDYSRVMEYVFVVTVPEHEADALAIIPSHCGLIRYELKKERFRTEEIKPAVMNPFIDMRAQIRNLTSQDIAFILKKIGIRNLPATRAEREPLLIEMLGADDMNEFFKLALKHKFSRRWAYLQKVINDIQPIDAQMFFMVPSDPKWVYYKNCSSV